MSARTLPSLPTFSAETGVVVTASQMALVTAYQQFWADPPMFRMYQTAGQSVASGANTQITCDNGSYDTDSGRSGSSPYSYTIPFAGRWRITGLVVWPTSATGARQTLIFQNGSAIIGAFSSTPGVALTNGTQVTVTVPCNVGDVIALYAWQNSGGPLTTNVGSAQNSFIEGELVSLASP
jgi:hypothetical protein